MARLNYRSQWLLRYLYSCLPYGHASINALPSDAPLGIDMANMRGLMRAGLVDERSHGIFYCNEEGILWCNDNPAVT